MLLSGVAVVVIVVVSVLAVVWNLCNKYSATNRLKAVAWLRTVFPPTLSLPLAAMPNGHRDAYTVASGRAPSPDHTSDEEDVGRQKWEYHARSTRALPRFVGGFAFQGPFGWKIFEFLRYIDPGRWWEKVPGSRSSERGRRRQWPCAQMTAVTVCPDDTSASQR